jgi:hypothetical protein
MFDNQLYNIFETDLLDRSIQICGPVRANGPAVAACAEHSAIDHPATMFHQTFQPAFRFPNGKPVTDGDISL